MIKGWPEATTLFCGRTFVSVSNTQAVMALTFYLLAAYICTKQYLTTARSCNFAQICVLLNNSNPASRKCHLNYFQMIRYKNINHTKYTYRISHGESKSYWKWNVCLYSNIAISLGFQTWVIFTYLKLWVVVNEMKYNESGFRPPLCTYRLNWGRRLPWGWWYD